MIESLFKLIENLPDTWKIIATFLILLGVFIFVIRKQLQPIILKLIPSKKTKMKKVVLSEHKLFTEESFFKYKISLINIGSDKKNHIFKTLLLEKYKSILKYSNELKKTKDLDKLTNTQFYTLLLENMTNIILEYNDNLKLKMGEDVFKLIMEHDEKGFNVIHEKTIFFIKNQIEETLLSNHVVFTTPDDKIDFLYDMYYIAFKVSMTDVNRIYSNFNGDLDILLDK